ncbi:uncharacterized protein LOC119360513 [Triticum dicoccoides]|uniref:uncharacterized protein LOC119360513 n=1 Tax=Triticum dicoccoides TaxID=85692 RepID=UPI00188E8BF2|nr:uncharacterized protein LOC119360513 [Triticum dicoccoides]
MALRPSSLLFFQLLLPFFTWRWSLYLLLSLDGVVRVALLGFGRPLSPVCAVPACVFDLRILRPPWQSLLGVVSWLRLIYTGVLAPLFDGRFALAGLVGSVPTRGSLLMEILIAVLEEISLGKRPVDCTIGSAIAVGSSSSFDGFVSAVRPVSVRTNSLVVEVADRSNSRSSNFPAGVHLDGYLVGAPSVLNRPRVVPLRAAGAFGRPTPPLATSRGVVLWRSGFVLPEVRGFLLVL